MIGEKINEKDYGEGAQSMLQPRDNGTIMKMISSDDEGTTTELFRDEDKIKQYIDVDEHIKQ